MPIVLMMLAVVLLFSGGLFASSLSQPAIRLISSAEKEIEDIMPAKSGENKPECAEELKGYLESILKLSEGRELIAAVQREGSIRIAVNRIQSTQQFGAFWDMDRRTIFVNRIRGRTEGELIASILFELHNAAADAELNLLDRKAREGRITRRAYIEAVERVEYRNSHQASQMSVQGIKKGAFPETAYLPVYPSFEAYFRVQQQAGHSAWIGRTYDLLRS